MDLELKKLRSSPSCDDLVLLDGSWVEVYEERLHEILLDYDVVGIDVEWVLADSEDLRPKKLLEFKVFISHLEEWLSSIPIDFIIHRVRGHLLKDVLFSSIRGKEVLVALWA